jgi:hypothetical protein
VSARCGVHARRLGDLNCGPEYLPIETALGMRLQVQNCNQLSSSWVHYAKRVPNRREVLRVLCESLPAKHECTIFGVDLNGLTFADFAFENVDREWIEDFFLNGTS